MKRSNGRPEPEVIVNFADGMAYSKGKMEEAFRHGGMLEKPYKSAKENVHVKREDVDVIVHELEISRMEAEHALIAADGDVVKALQTLIA
ncbi:hypothetical protein NM688_g7128 [Phlebia brevispora]|uniref:Uncharacterized protein n=1 Tax=Phlebia brevispora TaxID=194682 RepID=A0ACC1S8X1_9APHY|nr:hypothetical protein NM688_g7128 [Phlebia brevispora]